MALNWNWIIILKILYHNVDNKTNNKALNLLKLDCSSSSGILSSSNNYNESTVGKVGDQSEFIVLHL